MNVAVVGLGYVGLPLAIEMAKHFNVRGFDISAERVASFQQGIDLNGEVASADLKATNMSFHCSPELLQEADIIIIAVPTPIDEYKAPDLSPLLNACKMVAEYMAKGVTVCFESTVFPGTTEEYCIPVLERTSGLTWQQDFFVGYSPERINPGDKVNTFANITKVVSADTPETLAKLAKLYSTAVTAGIYQAESIKVAEAAKVIENTQAGYQYCRS